METQIIGPEALPIPRSSSLKQVTLAKAILEADLTKDTWTDILGKAGYSPKTIRSGALDIRDRPGVKRALDAIQSQKADTAREIKRKASAGVLKELDTATADPSFALSAWATASKIAAEYPEDEAGVSYQERDAAKQMVLKYCRIAARVARYRALSPRAITKLLTE